MDVKILRKFDPFLKEAFETPPFSFALAGNLMAVLKRQLMEEGIRDFPVIALTGAPGSGKTSVARACMAGKEKEFLFTDRVSAVKKELAKPQMQDQYILLDDCADFASPSARQKASSFLDEIVRGSYNGSLPLVVITVEENALSRITQSCRMRLLEVPVGDVLKDDRLTAILNYLQQNRMKLSGLFEEFREWYRKNCSQYHYAAFLNGFREKYQGRDARSISLFSLYSVSARIFGDFMKTASHIELSMSRIEENYLSVWERRECSTMSRKDLVKRLFQALIDDGAFQPTAPDPKSLCTVFCAGKCRNVGWRGELCCEDCDFYPEPSEGRFYDPRDLLLGDGTGAAVLIECGKYIYQYPAYCDGGTPLLILRDAGLFSLLNDELHKLCSEKNIRLQWLGPKEMHQLLFESDMCLYNYISREHKTYVFKYMSFPDTDVSVMILRLTREQYKVLKKNAMKPPWNMMVHGEGVEKFCKKLKEIGCSVHGRAGE